MLRGELFATDMVRAYQEGRKLHTARPVKLYKAEHIEVDTDGSIIGIYDRFEGRVRPITDYAKHRPGDYIYCRETWRDVGSIGGHGIYDYKADGCDPKLDKGPLCWRPSIHMPREAARLFWRVTKMEVMRLEDVTEEFAREDGFQEGWDHEIRSVVSAEWRFRDFWLETYGPAARWMWVYWTAPCSREEAMGNGLE